ncbi:hypothetical protein UNH65_13940 [Chitinophaga sp. 180180018-2]|nr:hypothetical protein [Chitinophaga sp. 212800010-3]
MDFLKRISFDNNSDFAQIICVVVILISVSYIGYMMGKFLWYVMH